MAADTLFEPTTNILIVDENAAAKQTLKVALRELGTGKAELISKPSEALRVFEKGRFHLVLCAESFSNDCSALELLATARERRVLPLATAFVLLSRKQALPESATDVKADGCLLMPATFATIEEALFKVWQRHQFFLPIYRQIDASRDSDALRMAKTQLQHCHPSYRIDLVRIICNLLLQQGKAEEAATFFKLVQRNGPQRWAQLGICKCLLALGHSNEAEEQLHELVAETPDYLEAYDLLAHIYITKEEPEMALEVVLESLKVVPGDLKRMQMAGENALLLGRSDLANEHLSQVVASPDFGKGDGNSQRSALVLLQMVLSCVRLNKAKQATTAMSKLVWMRNNTSCSKTIQLVNLAEAAHTVASGNREAGYFLFRDLVKQAKEAEFDFELVCHLLTALPEPEGMPADLRNDIKGLLNRYVRVKATDLRLDQAAQHSTGLLRLVRECSTDITQITNEGMTKIAAKDLEGATAHFFKHGMETLNPRLLLPAANSNLRLIKEMAADPAAETEERQVEIARLLKQAQQCASKMIPEVSGAKVVDALWAEIKALSRQFAVKEAVATPAAAPAAAKNQLIDRLKNMRKERTQPTLYLDADS